MGRYSRYYGGWIRPPMGTYATSKVDSADDLLWYDAVSELEDTLKDTSAVCNCSCGEHGCTSSKGAWK